MCEHGYYNTDGESCPFCNAACEHGQVGFCNICDAIAHAQKDFYDARCFHGVSYVVHCPQCSAEIELEIENSRQGVEFLEEQAILYMAMARDYPPGSRQYSEFEQRAAKLRAQAITLSAEIYAMSA
jgi:hypothetical protein